MKTNPWQLGPAERGIFAEILATVAENFRRKRDAPGFVRPAPYCVEDLIIMCEEAGNVETGMIFTLISALLREGDEARDAVLGALVDVADGVIDEESFLDPERN